MATFKYPEFLTQAHDQAFDQVVGVGQPTPYSGVYRCVGCGLDIAANYGNPMPPQNYHQHPPQLGDVGWQLIVMSSHR